MRFRRPGSTAPGEASSPTQERGSYDSPLDAHCLRCDAVLDDQEWCLECGAARTLIHRPPDWRVPVAVIATLIALVLAAFLIALIDLSGNVNGNASVDGAMALALGRVL